MAAREYQDRGQFRRSYTGAGSMQFFADVAEFEKYLDRFVETWHRELDKSNDDFRSVSRPGSVGCDSSQPSAVAEGC